MIKPSTCSPCPLVNISNGFIKSEGTGNCGVMFMGEAGGYEEYLDGLPFRPKAASGSVLEKAIRQVSSDLSIPLTRNNFLLYNIVNCNPPGNELEGKWYYDGVVKNCSRNWSSKIREWKVPEGKKKTIITLGNVPLKNLTSFTGESGSKQSISHLRGFVFENSYFNCYIVPTLHPSFIRRGNLEFFPLLVEDIKKGLRVANGSYTNFPSHSSYRKPEYVEFCNLDNLGSFWNKIRENSRLLVSYDIETPFSAEMDEDERDELNRLERGGVRIEDTSNKITQIQFSVGKNSAICVKWNDRFLPLIRKILKSENPKVGFNCWNFDNPRIFEELGGSNSINGRNDDVMWMFKHWHPRLPRNLQNVASLFDFGFPWKHLFGSKLEWYGCADVASLHWIVPGLVKGMREI